MLSDECFNGVSSVSFQCQTVAHNLVGPHIAGMPAAPRPLDAFMSFLAARHEILRCNVSLGCSAETFDALSRECSIALVFFD